MLSAAVFGMEDGDGFLRVVDFSCMSGMSKVVFGVVVAIVDDDPSQLRRGFETVEPLENCKALVCPSVFTTANRCRRRQYRSWFG